MTKQSLDDLFASHDAERLAEILREEARQQTPEAKAALARKLQAEHAKGVRLGYLTPEGDYIDHDETDEPEEDEEDEGE